MSKDDFTGFTRVLSEDKETLYFVKDGRKYRRFGNKLVEFGDE